MLNSVSGRIRAALMAGSAALAAGGSASAQVRKAVDVELVLAVDVSQSMDYEEHELQRNGYVDAFRSKDVIEAITSGPEGRIAVTYMEWAGMYEPVQTIGWTIIDSPKAARDFADRLAAEEIYGEQRTSISSALIKATELIETNEFISHRRVIDVSGDGANNTGPQVDLTRDEVLKRDITINGLPIMLNKPKEFYDIDHLDRYYKHCVIGGPAAFIAPVYDLRHLAATIRKKLVMEIAGRDVAPEASPIQFADSGTDRVEQDARIQRVQLKLPTEKTDCLIGEKVWGGGRGGGWQGRSPGGFGDPR
ncbi:MAG: DUF1194 domain-containing protein [Alphaproteobacteria bacterium]|nr:DUF1194 domain-containing protein [Alphaproteobacteria bacterium]